MKYILSIVILVVVLFPRTDAQAYLTTNQAAFRLTDTAALFLIEYKFGHGDHEIHMPIAARMSEEGSRTALSYVFYDENNEVVTDVRSSAIVLSNSTVRDNTYVVPKGQKNTFTLFVLATFDENTESIPLRAEVSYLPFSFDGTEELQLNPSELKYYTTVLLAP